MKKTFIHFFLVLFPFATVISQITYTFENLNVPPDSFISPKNLNGGFGDSLIYFYSEWDTAFGGYWAGGFAPSTKKDKVTPGFTNQYSAITASGYNSNTYAVSYGNSSIKLRGSAAGKPVKGFYITNTTYAFYSMKDGDAFAKKFGGQSGNDPDFFYVVVKGFLNGNKKNDSVKFYLADFRFTNNQQDYILDQWSFVDLSVLGNVDSLTFELQSSDIGQFGMNTPAYFAMDNFTFKDVGTSVEDAVAARWSLNSSTIIEKNQPIIIENKDAHSFIVKIVDVSGAVLRTQSFQSVYKAEISTEGLMSGYYFLNIESDKSHQTLRFLIQ
ncbi:MAG: DUF4465 domain-containing protein [Chitinophagales bacterium]|nr:DUF4465 domain-containing protein [Chitinophagales bacterium]MDW8273472.1 DUF4465 domain-containing protein [Chitinophagales bacterium]